MHQHFLSIKQLYFEGSTSKSGFYLLDDKLKWTIFTYPWKTYGADNL